MIRALILCLLLTACASQPRVAEYPDAYIIDQRIYVRHSDRLTADQITAVSERYSVPVFDERERAMWRHLLIGHGLDLGTTLVGLNMGCVEGNPLLGKSPSIGVLVLIKALPLAHWRYAAKRSPAAFSTADNLVSKINVLSGYGAAGLNIATIARGCM